MQNAHAIFSAEFFGDIPGTFSQRLKIVAAGIFFTKLDITPHIFKIFRNVKCIGLDLDRDRRARIKGNRAITCFGFFVIGGVGRVIAWAGFGGWFFTTGSGVWGQSTFGFRAAIGACAGFAGTGISTVGCTVAVGIGATIGKRGANFVGAGVGIIKHTVAVAVSVTRFGATGWR